MLLCYDFYIEERYFSGSHFGDLSDQRLVVAFHANHRTGRRCSWSSRFLPWAVTLVGHTDSGRTGTAANIAQFLRINKVLVTQSYQTLCDSLDCSPPGSSIHGDSPGKNTGVGTCSLLQGIFPTQELNWGLLH